MWKLIFSILILNSSANAANILAIFPVPSLPHQKIFRALTEALEDRGHHLTIISTDPQLSRGHANTIEIDLKFSYVLLQKALFSMSFKETKNELDALAIWFDYELEILEKQFESEDVQYLLRNKDEKFDLVIVEAVGHTPWHALAEYFNARLIGITANEANLEFHDIIGNSANPIRDPDILLPQSDEMTFQERYKAWWFHIIYNFYYKNKFHAKFDALIQKFLPNVKSNSQQLKEALDLLLINTHPAMLYSRPMVPTSIQLGFLHVKPPKEIENEALKKFLDESEKSVIYMSFGTSVNSTSLQEPFIEMFQNVFKALPFNVIWKWEAEEMKNKPENVFITQWTPQADLLAHPKIKLFITHGGQLSIEEAIDRAVPMIVIPFFNDQFTNSMKVQQLSIGLAADLQSLNEKFLRQLIDEVIYGSQYKENILKLQKFIHDSPMRPVDKAVWWIEYVLRHNGTSHLKYSGKDVPFYQKYMLDFAAIAIVVLHIFVGIFKTLLAIVFIKCKDYVKMRIAKKNQNPIARKIKNKKKKE
ncbi:hypothetical protein PVAND_012802 [Polypedilum vanderplanki]|uniref:UDP-glucuronosyltransferase n=1 Tax=Polypedilum vanderplanki TaxID=319348 RepID=A0A9J6CNJ7_POLVA|nr:hypothetical protein PVAND_012802 [Polypedilum vanderplanki]